MRPELFLIGDSHIIAIAEAAAARAQPYQGGPLCAGRFLEEPFYEMRDGNFAYTLPGAEPIQARFASLSKFKGPVLTTLGFNSHRFVKEYSAYCRSQELACTAATLSSAAFVATVCDSRRVALRFYEDLAAAGLELYFSCSPQRIAPELFPLLRAFEDVLIAEISARGATFLDVRPKIMIGTEPDPKFIRPSDKIHGNIEWGTTILEELDKHLKTQRS